MMTRRGRHEKTGLRSRFSRNARLSMWGLAAFCAKAIWTDTGPRMIRTSIALPHSPISLPHSSAARVKIAVAFTALLALLALGPLTTVEKPPVSALALTPPPAPRVTAEAPAAPLRSYAYYPEQLAALQSLSAFQPIAETGENPAPLAAAKPGVAEAKILRRAEPVTKLAMIAPLPPVLPSRTPSAAPEPKAETKFFGLSLPDGADLGGRVAGLRDTATHWGEAAVGWSGGIVKLWR
jgi:hypothetical protein